MFVYSMMEAMKQVSPERWEKYKEYFSQDDLQCIADSYKLYNKYMMMKEVQNKVQQGLIQSYMKYKNDYREFMSMLDRILGFETDEEIHVLTELFAGEKQRAKKVKQVQELIDEKELKFKPIEWSPEQIFSIPDILKDNEKK